jgi:uncharacterized protein DUF1259
MITACSTYPRLAAVLVLSLFCSVLALPAAARDAGATLDQVRIEQLTGLKGSFNAGEGVFTVKYPREDLAVYSGGVRISPALGLTAWAAFTRTGSHVTVMGDMVLLEDQVNPVMSVALDSGLQVTALHNHFSMETPRIMFMHIAGMGDEEQIAKAVGNVIAKIKSTAGGKTAIPATQIDPGESTLNPAPIAQIVGTKGELSKGVYKITIGRIVGMNGHEMGGSMGVNSWAAFAGSDAHAVVAGDIATHEDELQAVLKSLRSNGINIVAIHNHMTFESPRIVFLHYWGEGSVRDLAAAVKAVFDLLRD